MGRWWLGVLALGCREPARDGLPPREDTAAEPPANARPLCLEAGPRPVVAPDLVAWAEAFVDSDSRFYGQAEWQALESRGESLGSDPGEEVRNRLLRGWHRLKFDDPAGAILDLEKAEARAIAHGLTMWRGRARQLLGAAWMRKAEIDNCISRGGSSACIAPFDEGAIHDDPTGMTHAGEVFGRFLEEDLPDHLSVRWLLNVTYMARGTWPDEVPEQWRLPDSFLASETTTEPFVNVLPGLGYGEATISGGAALEDFDGDGLLDILFSEILPTGGMDLYLNMGDGGYCRASDASGVSAIVGILGFQPADYDNDGDVDVLAPRGAWQMGFGVIRPSLLRNDGAGHFEDVAVEAGLADPAVNGPSQVGTWGDIDADGWLDVFVGRESGDGTDGLPTWRSSLYHNRGDGTFEDLAASAGVADAGFVKGASFFDFDDDGDVDLYVSSLRSPDRLYENRGDLSFVDRAPELGVTEPFASFPCAPLDYDQDGRVDLFVGAFTNNYAGGGPLDPSYFTSGLPYVQGRMGLSPEEIASETAHLYRNTPGGFVDVTAEVGLDDYHATMGLSVGDANQDGWPDLYLSTGAPEFDALEPNVLYLNDGGRRFLDATGVSRTGHLQKGHQVSFGDADEDGDEDLLVELGGAFPGDASPNVLFENPSSGAGARHAVTLRLQGVSANRGAIGARVAVVTPGRTFHHVVGQTGSFGANSLQLEVGLAEETEVSRVEIRWPGDPVPEVVEDVPLDAVVVLRQGEGVVSSAPYRRLGFAEQTVPTGTDPFP